ADAAIAQYDAEPVLGQFTTQRNKRGEQEAVIPGRLRSGGKAADRNGDTHPIAPRLRRHRFDLNVISGAIAFDLDSGGLADIRGAEFDGLGYGLALGEGCRVVALPAREPGNILHVVEQVTGETEP